jgi:copper homeostasis protein
MVRPRGGSYVHTPAELASMHGAIDDALEDGTSGIVIGVLDSSNRIDAPATRELVRRAGSVPVTFHRAFDEVDDQLMALDTLVDAGFARVLTGGGRGTALDGASRLRQLVTHARGRISIMAGGKVRPDNARAIVDQSGVSELHARSELDPSRIRGIIAALNSAI